MTSCASARFAGFVLTTSLLSRPAEAAPIILEVFYDASGADTGRVFTGIYGEAGMSLDG